MTKRISIDQLKPGMFVVGLDKSWWQTPFFSHQRIIHDPGDINKLKEIGVQEVEIDLSRGCDVEAKPNTLNISIFEPPLAPTQETRSTPERAPSPPPPGASFTIDALNEAMPAVRAARNEALAILEGIFAGVKIGKPIDSPAIKQAVVRLLDSILRHPEASLMLMQMQRFEADLLSHAVDVCMLSLLIGKQQALSAEQFEALGVGALLHDVGKMRLPRNLLRRSTEYSAKAQKLLQEHPRLGVALLAQNKDLSESALRIILEHHERLDGSGFPEGRTGATLSPLSHIVIIVNIYDALVSGHSGQPAHLPTQALRRLYQMGRDGQLAGDQVAWLIRTLGVYPVGAVVELNTGERGIVVATNSAAAQKPVVLVVCRPDGQPFSIPRLVNLTAKAENEPVHAIVRALEITALPTALADYFTDTLQTP
ncbi:MAG TPA: DUF3391 domain-containing protein [Methylomirabilota bacterium]|jgi:HD-GYP domain-containing protein (c-di-GMP phosphodiesterase class II)|nr:DUF3391 domain-containing protein [Methylomirabilota bacterium]